MKRASYREGVQIIAFNDEPTCMNEEEVFGMVTVMMLAALFCVPQERVARDVVRLRKKDAVLARRAQLVKDAEFDEEDRMLATQEGDQNG